MAFTSTSALGGNIAATLGGAALDRSGERGELGGERGGGQLAIVVSRTHDRVSR